MQRLNIILIVTDDLGWRDLSCQGSSFYETPCLDCLAASGMRFTDAYAACPVCSPSRASILTGRYPARIGITDWIDTDRVLHPCRGKLVDAPYLDHLPLHEETLASLLKEADYQTWHVGKWHLGTEPYWPEHHGFDVNIAGCSWGAPHHGYFAPWGNPRLDEGAPGEYLTDRLTDEAVALIRNRNKRKPFFLNLWHYAVHTPIQVREEWAERWRRKAHEMGLDRVDAFADGEPYPTEHKRHLRVRRRMVQSDPDYAAMIANLDANIGRLLQELDEAGIADQTVVVFTSDNGGLATSEGSPTCNLPLQQGKGWMYEGGLRVPLIIRWPNRTQPGSVCHEPVTSPDLFPTLLTASGLRYHCRRRLDGIDIGPMLHGALQPRGPIYWHYPHYGNQGGTPGGVVRLGDRKLIDFYEDGHVELYNLREDPGEQRNLASDDPHTARMLQNKLASWRLDVGGVMCPQATDSPERHDAM